VYCFAGHENIQLNQLLVKLDVIEEGDPPPHHRDETAYAEALRAAFRAFWTCKTWM
jgi:hypothetical protein